MIVADTCLITHLFNETPLTKLAQKILEKESSWFVPPLWQEEYANVISKMARKEKKHSEEAVKHFNYTVQEMRGCEIPVQNEQALRLSIEFKISVYDAHFVSLAINLNTVLVTEDKEVLKHCPYVAVSMIDFLKM